MKTPINTQLIPVLAPLTEEQFKEALPAKLKKSVNQKILDSINNTLCSEETMEIYRENLLSYGDVLKEGRFKLSSYVNAVKYVSHKSLGCTNRDAYIKTFPDKYQKFLANKTPEKDIASYTTAYNQSKLVMLIYEQTLIPTQILNAPYLQEAINTQVNLMLHARSEMVRCNAAACLIKELKPDVTKKFELDIGTGNNESIRELQEATARLAKVQRDLIIAGSMTTKQIAESTITCESKQ